jgi:hypothetical protein
MKFLTGDKVVILRGKYAGKTGVFYCFVNKHHLSDKQRLQVSVQSGMGWKTLLLNETGVKGEREQ